MSISNDGAQPAHTSFTPRPSLSGEKWLITRERASASRLHVENHPLSACSRPTRIEHNHNKSQRKWGGIDRGRPDLNSAFRFKKPKNQAPRIFPHHDHDPDPLGFQSRDMPWQGIRDSQSLTSILLSRDLSVREMHGYTNRFCYPSQDENTDCPREGLIRRAANSKLQASMDISDAKAGMGHPTGRFHMASLLLFKNKSNLLQYVAMGGISCTTR